MYYWTVLHKSKSELVRSVYETQQMSPVRNDWCLQLSDDLGQCDIQLSESDIMNMKKTKFKKLVSKSVREVARQYLITLKEKHSKSTGLSDHYQMQAYLTSNNMTTEQKQLLFQFRTRTYPCRTNYRKLYENDLSCQICLEEDSPEHLLACSRITAGIDITGVLISDIFGSTDQQIKIAKILKKITFNRKIILEQISQ